MATEATWETVPDARVEGWEPVRPRVRQPSIYAPREEWARYRAAQASGDAAPAPTGQLRSQIAPMPPPMDVVKGTAKALAGALLETPATMVTGAVATPVAGVAALGRTAYDIATGKPTEQALARGAEAVESVQQAMTYQPRTQAGQAFTAMASAPFVAATETAGQVGGAVGEMVGGEQGRMVGEAVGKVTPEVALTAVGGRQALRAQPGRPTGPAQFTQEQDAIAAAQQSGFRALPTESRGGAVNVAVESVAKQAPLVKRLVQYNEERASQLVRQDLGLSPTGRLDEQAITNIRNQAGAVYDQLRALPDVINVRATDPAWITKVQDLDMRFRSIKAAMPDMYRSGGLERLRGSMGRINTLTPEQIVDITKNLRDTATRTLKRTDAPSESIDAAYAFKEAANMMEDLLETHLSQTNRQGALDRFRRARELYAKSYVAEDVTNLTTGKVDPQALRRAMERGEPLTGNMRRVADAAAAMPSVMRRTEGLTTPEGMVLSDWAMGAGIPAAIFSGQPGIAAGLAAGAAARPAVRSMAAGERYQRLMAQPRGRVPTAPVAPAVPGMVTMGVAAQPRRERAPFLMGEETE